jgi:hypothetical protein
MRRIGVVLSLTLLLASQSAAQKFPEYPVLSASQYSSCQTKNGIRMAIEPVNEGDKQKKYFGVKFESQGFLPVLVVLENASESSSALLRRDLVTYGIGDNQSKSGAAGDISAKSKTGETVAVAGAVAFLPAMFIGAIMVARATEVKQNILVKELRSQTIAPGEAGSGFLYVPVGKPGTEKRKFRLNVPLSLDDSQETLGFTFDLEVQGGGNKK